MYTPRVCGHILFGFFYFFNIMLHTHVPTVIYKRSGTVLYLFSVKYYLSFCFLNFIRDVFVIEFKNICLQMSVWNRKALLFIHCCVKSRKIYVGNPCLMFQRKKWEGAVGPLLTTSCIPASFQAVVHGIGSSSPLNQS
jgi:hypothetical protein